MGSAGWQQESDALHAARCCCSIQRYIAPWLNRLKRSMTTRRGECRLQFCGNSCPEIANEPGLLSNRSDFLLKNGWRPDQRQENGPVRASDAAPASGLTRCLRRQYLPPSVTVSIQPSRSRSIGASMTFLSQTVPFSSVSQDGPF